jgi:surface polysaccharide O-acyltransferase-like enzyme
MGRITSVDLIRIIAIFAVILLHTETLFAPITSGSHVFDSYVIVNQLARFAVPFFFVVSGYFWGVKVRRDSPIFQVSRDMILRIAALYLFWIAIYFFPFDSVMEQGTTLRSVAGQIHWKIRDRFSRPLFFVFNGSKYHLWFLPALICSIAISGFFVRFKRTALLVGIAILLYLLGLSMKAYIDSPFGIRTDHNSRNGAFFGTLFFVAGYILSGYVPKKSWFPIGFVVACTGVVLHFTELHFLNQAYGTTFRQDYVLGTFFTGVGVALMALSGFRVGFELPVLKLGSLVLGVYACHVMFVDLFIRSNTMRPASTGTLIGMIGSISICSFLFAYFMSRVRFTSRFVK